MTIDLPEYVVKILNVLKRAGYCGYAVGGCVRDALMGRTPSDYDITTIATPQQVCSLFDITIQTGERYGTVTVVLGKNHVEVTTFRIDGEYKDSRRPEIITRTANVNEDLARRDFTVNAMCYSPDSGLIDPFGGAEDIDLHLIKTVGDPDRRFCEDALRILRGVRFCATLGFEAENLTLLAMINNANLLKNISGERIRDELCKILLSDSPETLNSVLMAGGLSHISLKASEELFRVSHLPNILDERLCAFLMLCSQNVESSVDALKLSRREAEAITSIIDVVNKQILPDRIHIKHLLKVYDPPVIMSAVRVKQALYDDDSVVDCLDVINDVVSGGEPYRVSQLAVNGDDILAAGLARDEGIGRLLNFLLECVVGNPQLNTKEMLMSMAQTYVE